MASKDKGEKRIVVDEFDAYGQIFIENKKYRRREIYLVIFAALCAFGFFVKSMQPPVVIVKDNINPENGAKIVQPGNAPEIRKQDAESLFIYAVNRRWGWHSTTVFKDLVEVRDMFTPEMRKAFLAYVNDYSTTEQEAKRDKVERKKRIQEWIEAKVRNTVKMPREDIECTASKEEGAWYCRAKGEIETAPLFGEMNVAMATSVPVEFRCKIHPFTYTPETPWGMIISYLDAVKGKAS